MPQDTQRLKLEIVSTLDMLSSDSLELLAEFVTFLRVRIKPVDNTAVLQKQQLAQDYETLAVMYHELAEELSDEVWLPLENEVLFKVER